MVNIISVDGKPVYGLYEYVCDYAEDYKTLPTNCAVGSRAFIIENSKVYMMNSSRKWVEI